MQKRGILYCMLILVLGGLSFRPAPPDLSSPKATVRSFIKAFSERCAEDMIACIQGAGNTKGLSEIFKQGVIKVETGDILAEEEGDTARVAVEFTLSTDQGFSLRQVNLLKLHKEGVVWKILSDPKMRLDVVKPQQNSLIFNVLIGIATLSEEEFNKEKTKAQGTSSLSNGKQIGLGILMYVQDYDEIYPHNAAQYKTLIFPYIKNEQVFTAPPDPKGTLSYTFNANLQRVHEAAIEAPAKTILLYEGKDQMPLYRYEGKAVIVFADGHAKLCTPEEVKAADWGAKYKVKPTPPKKPAPVKKPKKGRG